MIEHTLSFKLPENVHIQRIVLNDKGSWDVACFHLSAPDKHGVTIPSQVGYAFKQHKLERAIELAGADARDKFNRLKAQRNSRRPPTMTEEEELLGLLDL